MEPNQLPQDWRIAQLQEITRDFISGGTPSTDEPLYWDGEIPWTTSAPISEDDTRLESGQRFISQSGLEQSSTHLVPKGNLIVGTRVGVGKAAINEINIAISQDLTGVVLRNETIEPEFLAYQFKTGRVQTYFENRKRGTTIKGVSRLDLERLPLFLPPLEEQKAITGALRAVQEAMAVRQRERGLERERKAALMHHLFLYGTQEEPLKETLVGKIPQSWRIETLGDLCENGLGVIQTGPFGSQLHASDYRETGIPVVNPTHLDFNSIVENELPKIDRKDADRLSKHYLIHGDILISRRGDFSRYSYIDNSNVGWLCGTGCLLIRMKNPAVDNFFLAISIGSQRVQNYFQQSSVGSIMPNLNTRILKSLPLILPPFSEQVGIAEVLRACEEKVTALEKEITYLNELFRALLEQLMTGQLSVRPSIEKPSPG